MALAMVMAISQKRSEATKPHRVLTIKKATEMTKQQLDIFYKIPLIICAVLIVMVLIFFLITHTLKTIAVLFALWVVVAIIYFT